MIRAAIFDMDGVIVNTEPYHRQSEYEVLKKYGVDMSEDDFKRYSGTTLMHMFNELIQIHGIKADATKMGEEKTELVFRMLHNNVHNVPGIKEFIQDLKTKDIKIALATSSKKDFVEFILKETDMEKTFEAMITADDVTKSKPNPEAFLKAASALDVKPSECIVFEDAMHGVAAAKAAGMLAVGYQNPNSCNQDLSKADIMIKDFSELDIKELISMNNNQ